MRPGFLELTLSLESQVTLTGVDLVGRDPTIVVGHYSTGTGAALERTWATMIQGGVEDIIQKMELKIKSPAEVSNPIPQAGVAPPDGMIGVSRKELYGFTATRLISVSS